MSTINYYLLDQYFDQQSMRIFSVMVGLFSGAYFNHLKTYHDHNNDDDDNNNEGYNF
jgi:hypothetical protein